MKKDKSANSFLPQLPGDGIKRDPERENCAVLTIAAQTANSIHIRVTFNAVTRYIISKYFHPLLQNTSYVLLNT